MAGLIKKYSVPLLFICGALLFACANVQRVAIPGAVFNELQMKWSLTASQVTGFGASFMYVYAISQLFVGLFCDRFGGARVIAAGGIVFSLGSFIFAFMDNYCLLCIGRGLTGLGGSTFYLGLVTEAIRYFKKNYSSIISIIIMTGYAGGIMANAPFSFAVSHSSLRIVLAAVATLQLGLYLFYLMPFSSISKPPVRDVPFSCKSFVNVMKIKSNWNIYLFFSVHWGLFYSIQTVIGKKFLEDFCRIPSSTAAVFLSTTSLITAASGFVYVIGCKKLGNRRKPFCLLTAFTTLLFFLLMVILTALNIRNIIPAVLICLFASTSSLSAIVIPMIKENNASGETSSAIAFANSFSYVLVAVFGNVIGGMLSLFTPENVGGKLIYSRSAYLSVFCVMLVCAFGVLHWAWNIKEGTEKTRLRLSRDNGQKSLKHV